MTSFARSDARELMDAPVDSLSELEENLRDLERANRWFGGVAPIAHEIRRRGARRILDVGCGGGDIARALARAARDRGESLSLTCLDSSEQILELARRRTGTNSDLTFVRGNGTRLPFGDGAFDLAFCSLVLHHAAPEEEAIALLRELRRVSRLTPIVADLYRSRAAYVAIWTFLHLASRNRLTVHDGPLSVRRAYTPAEAVELARAAGWKKPVARRTAWFRMIVLDEGA
ncbi:MAG: methyltransferase domain-containing protein [Candidatus Eremiobacteraeota bacterium]|nr:methyltransferase domain-containing protein [Candidatus Eremiobacteraeota bacterium]